MKIAVIALKNRNGKTALKMQENLLSELKLNFIRVDELRVLFEPTEQDFNAALTKNAGLTIVLDDYVGVSGAKIGLYDLDGALTIFGAERFKKGYKAGDNYILTLNSGDEIPAVCAAACESLGLKVKRDTFKLLGVSETELKSALDKITEKYKSVLYQIEVDGLDAKVDFYYIENALLVDVDGARKEFIKQFSKSVYAADDVSIEKRFCDVLRLRRLKSSTAESMTGGKIASMIVSVDGASDVFYEGLVTYDTLSKERRLGVNHKTVVDNTVVSSQVAYEMALPLLNSVDVAITITGYAGSSEHPDENDGLCFIGVGFKGQIEVYKFVFGKTRGENIVAAAKTALFLAIKTVEGSDRI